MKTTWKSMVWAVVFGVVWLAGSQSAEGGDVVNAVAVLPKVLYAGNPATVTVTTFSTYNRAPVSVGIFLWFGEGSATDMLLYQGGTDTGGRLTAHLIPPDVPPGLYSLEVQVAGMAENLVAEVQVREMPVLFVETDKPIYKPGQTIQGRVLVLNGELQPAPGDVDVEITDSKGVKIFRQDLTANAFGVAPFELALASELNYGTWKITAESGSASGVVDVRVEEYVLPRFEIDMVLGKDYFLVDEPIAGRVDANYFFGKVVEGTAEIVASRYVGIWEDYASYTAPLVDGSAAFNLPAVGYVSGTAGGGGAGSAQLKLVVTDIGGHEETTTKLLKIVDSTIQHQLIATSRVVVPGQPFEVLLVAEHQEGAPVTASAEVTCTYRDENWGTISEERQSVGPFEGSTAVWLTAPEGAALAELYSTASSGEATAQAVLTIYAAYSPSDSFLHLTRSSDEPIQVGDLVVIEAFKTHDATVYYDVCARGHTVWSGATTAGQIVFQATPQMAPSVKVVGYIINPNNEISADALPLDVVLGETTALDVWFDSEQFLPGDPVRLSVQADDEAMVGLALVDESVYALNEGRLNMQAVFDELERLFMEPQSETHEEWYNGAAGVFEEAGLQVLASDGIDVPEGSGIWRWDRWWNDCPDCEGPWVTFGGGDGSLAEVTRVRQFFPETWLWLPDLMTDDDGVATLDLTAPDSITTWRLHAVSTSDDGLGLCESEVLVFQEFFGEPDLPYAVTRGEQFPVRVQIFNYLDTPQTVQVELAEGDWFERLEPGGPREVLVGANSVGLASFLIEPTQLGHNPVEVTLRAPLRADAVRRELLVEPEGTQRECVENGMIEAGDIIALDTAVPEYRVPGSEKVLLSITPSLVAQSINGVDDLLGMPYGCGEQNMIFFAPDVEILRYLDATGQLTPEVRAKAEHFITVGYQRELTFQREDGSFSAFGDRDESGSLWLTAFVLGCFSAARDVQTIDEGVLSAAAGWVVGHQLPDGSWEPVGFLHHQEMIGAMAGTYALTGFVTIALADYGAAAPEVVAGATEYLAGNYSSVYDEAYPLAVAALALTRTGHPASETVLQRLLQLAISDAEGIHWEPHAIEITAYVALSLMAAEMPQANEAIKWLSLQQNSAGGFGHTQATVMALKALMTAAREQTRDVNLTITAVATDQTAGEVLAEFSVDSSNFDVLQMAELPAGRSVELRAVGSGESRFQLARRFNTFLCDEIVENDMSLEVVYDADHVEVDDIVTVTVTVRYFGAVGSSGMMIVDVGVPTGFMPLQDTLDGLVDSGVVSRVEGAGRKVIFYVDGLASGEVRTFSFDVKARFPVRAIIPDSAAYLYYSPDVRAEDAGAEITVGLEAGGRIDLGEFAALTAHWLVSGCGPCGGADMTGDGNVDAVDLAVLARDWLMNQ